MIVVANEVLYRHQKNGEADPGGKSQEGGGGGTNRLGDNSAAANRQIAANDERAC